MDKTKHRFNFIDVLIILTVVAVAAVLVKLYVFDGKSDVQTKNASIQYVVCTDMISEELSDNVTVGDTVFDYSSGKEIGKVIACDIRNATHTGTSQSGTPVVSEIVGSKVLYITVEATATVYDDGYYVGSVPVSVGNSFKFMLPKLYCTGKCISVEVIG